MLKKLNKDALIYRNEQTELNRALNRAADAWRNDCEQAVSNNEKTSVHEFYFDYAIQIADEIKEIKRQTSLPNNWETWQKVFISLGMSYCDSTTLTAVYTTMNMEIVLQDKNSFVIMLVGQELLASPNLNMNDVDKIIIYYNAFVDILQYETNKLLEVVDDLYS